MQPDPSNPITDILSKGDIAGGHRSRARSQKLLPSMKAALGLANESDPSIDPFLETFLAEVVLGAAWYQARYLQAGRKVRIYIMINCVLVIGIPLGLVGLGKLTETSIAAAVSSEVSGVLTGILALQKTLATWYSSQQRYAIWYKSAADLKTIYYSFIEAWCGKVKGNKVALVGALTTATDNARQIITNEQLDYYEKLALPSFDVLDMLTSTSSSVSTLVTSLLPGAPPVSISTAGKSSFLSAPQIGPLPEQIMPSQPAGIQKMVFSNHSLHRSVVSSQEHQTDVAARFAALIQSRSQIQLMAEAPSDPIMIPLRTVSLATDFDAYIDIVFAGTPNSSAISLLVDSGNSVLIVPRWEDITAIPNYESKYTVLGNGKEPWGCQAKIVRGPINIPLKDGSLYQIKDCLFYACTSNGDDGTRTANFGVACLSPWTASSWNTPAGINITFKAPLAYNTMYPIAVFDYEAATNIYGNGENPNISEASSLVLYKSMPNGYSVFNILPNKQWMALTPKSLSIASTKTPWPGAMISPIAMVDTGGGPAYLNDPEGYIYAGNWPDPTDNPCWTSTSKLCQSIDGSIGIELTDGTADLSYTINPSILPASAQGLSLVMCRDNAYMMGQNGMNIGGISALFNLIVIDYGSSRVGFRAK